MCLLQTCHHVEPERPMIRKRAISFLPPALQVGKSAVVARVIGLKQLHSNSIYDRRTALHGITVCKKNNRKQFHGSFHFSSIILNNFHRNVAQPAFAVKNTIFCCSNLLNSGFFSLQKDCSIGFDAKMRWRAIFALRGQVFA